MKLRHIILGLLLLPIIAATAFLLMFDASSVAPRLAAAVQAATGRTLTIEGPTSLVAGFLPKLTVEKVGLANIPGGSRPQMLTAAKLEAELGLLALLRGEVQITRLSLQSPDLLLERDAAGQPNWRFERPAGAPGGGNTAALAGIKLLLAVDALTLRDAAVTWRDLAPHKLTGAEIEANGRDPLRWRGSGTLDGLPVTLAAETGPLVAAFSGQDWPIRATIEAGKARLSLDGGMERGALAGRLAAQIPELAALAPLLAGQALPPLLGLEGAARLTPAGMAAVQAKIGDSPLDSLLPGLRLLSASASQGEAGQPVVLSAEATRGGLPFGLTGELGAAALTGGAGPLALTVSAGQARATLGGTLTRGLAVPGLEGRLQIGVPDLAALSPLVGLPLPGLGALQVDAQAQGGADGLALRNLLLRTDAGDLTGELLASTTDRLALRGVLLGRRLSLDAARSAAAAAPPSLLATPALPASPPTRRRGGTEPPAISRPAAGGRLLPATPWPYGFARALDGDIRIGIAELILNDQSIRDLEARVQMTGGQATILPLLANLPAGRVAGKLVIDAAAPPPRLALALRGEGLDVAALAALFGYAPPPAPPAPAPQLPLPGGLPVAPPIALGAAAPVAPATLGRVDLEADLHGAGESWRALAGTASGPLGLAMGEGQLDTGPGTLLGTALGDLRRAMPQLGRQPMGPVPIRCGALRVQMENGLARSQAFLIEGGPGRVGGGGSVSFAEESLQLRLLLDLDLPVGKLLDGVNSIRLRAPLPITGSFARPRADYGQAVARGAMSALGGLVPEAPIGPFLDCDVALAIARGTGRPTLAPIAAPGGTGPRLQPTTPPTQYLQDMLRGRR